MERQRKYIPHWGQGPGPRNTGYRTEKALEVRLDRLFGRMGVMAFGETYRKDGIECCYVCGIVQGNGTALRNTWINTWGSVHSIKCCSKHHKEWHGRCCDDLPASADPLVLEGAE
jgi:hypothetical protein